MMSNKFKKGDRVKTSVASEEAKDSPVSFPKGSVGEIESVNKFQRYIVKFGLITRAYLLDELELTLEYKTLAQLWADHMHPPFKAIHKNGTVVEILAIDYKCEAFGQSAIIKGTSVVYAGFDATDPVWQLYQEPKKAKEAVKCEHKSVHVADQDGREILRCDHCDNEVVEKWLWINNQVGYPRMGGQFFTEQEAVKEYGDKLIKKAEFSRELFEVGK